MRHSSNQPVTSLIQLPLAKHT